MPTYDLIVIGTFLFTSPLGGEVASEASG